MQEGLRVHEPRVAIRGSCGRYKPAVINKEVIRVPWAPCNPDYVTKREMRGVFLICANGACRCRRALRFCESPSGPFSGCGKS
jgi:hypothetical protein